MDLNPSQAFASEAEAASVRRSDASLARFGPVSAIVPVYGGAATLRELHRRLNAVLSRTCLDHEIVFVEDAGPDDAWRVIDALAREICRGLESPDRMQEIGRAARKRVEAEFNVRNTCNSIAAIYDRLLGNRAAVGA